MYLVVIFNYIAVSTDLQGTEFQQTGLLLRKITFSGVQKKQLSYFGVRKADVLVNSTTAQLQEIILLFRWMIQLSTKSIRKSLKKLSYKSNLTIHQVPNITPSLLSVVLSTASHAQCMYKNGKYHSHKTHVTKSLRLLITSPKQATSYPLKAIFSFWSS